MSTKQQGGSPSPYALRPKSKHPPKRKTPIVWRIMTNRPVLNASQAIEIIDWYRYRWEIEMFFDVLKVGCRVERLQLGTRKRVEKALLLIMN
ncbi:MAG: transposase [Cocleimonas sp.]|nr:transposase [Cocleimonas sp.]